MKKVIIQLLVVVLFGNLYASCSDELIEEPRIEDVTDKTDDESDDKTDDKSDDSTPIPVPGGSGKTYIVIPDKNGRIEWNEQASSTYKPGDIIYLRGKFKSVRITGLKGSSGQPIYITNYPGEVVTIGDPTWTGGTVPQAVRLAKCQYFVIGGTNSSSEFIIDGPKLTKPAYFDMEIKPFTDNLEIKNITIKNGGFGISAKTDPDINDPKTWYPNTQLNNLSIHDVIITGTSMEGMYIGFSALWWGWDENGNGYNAGSTSNSAHKYVQAIKWKNVKIYNNRVSDTGWDGIQVSASDQVEIYENEISNYGTRKEPGQCHGLIINPRMTNTNIYNNYVHDGYGELIQFQGANENQPSKDVIRNNLLVNSSAGNGIGLYDYANLTVTNNTIVHSGGYTIRANGRNVQMTGEHSISNNVFIESRVGVTTSEKDPYLKVENGAKVKESGNLRFASVKDAKVDANNYYRPVAGSTIGNAGYKK